MASKLPEDHSVPSEASVTPKDVLLFIPNLIGYTRILTAVLSFVCMKRHPVAMLSLYGISGFLDAFDGWAARKFDQGTRFGAVLDMVTDRCATTSLICYLCVLYPQYFLAWQLLVSLDLTSHYMHMYAMTTSGSASHKNVDAKQSKILNLYYTNRKVLFGVCLLNELFYVAVYLHSFKFFWLGTVMVFVSAPVWLFKQVANVIQLRAAALIMIKLDAADKAKRTKVE